MRLNALCEESSHWETGPNGTILASGIGEIGACRAFEAMCYSDSLMRPRRLEMLHRNCWQSSPPAQNPRPALRFRLDKRDECWSRTAMRSMNFFPRSRVSQAGGRSRRATTQFMEMGADRSWSFENIINKLGYSSRKIAAVEWHLRTSNFVVPNS